MGGGILWIGSQILVYYNMDKTVNVNKWMNLVKEMKSPKKNHNISNNLDSYQTKGSVKQKIKNVFRTKKQRKIDEANEEILGNQSHTITNDGVTVEVGKPIATFPHEKFNTKWTNIANQIAEQQATNSGDWRYAKLVGPYSLPYQLEQERLQTMSTDHPDYNVDEVGEFNALFQNKQNTQRYHLEQSDASQKKTNEIVSGYAGMPLDILKLVTSDQVAQGINVLRGKEWKDPILGYADDLLDPRHGLFNQWHYQTGKFGDWNYGVSKPLKYTYNNETGNLETPLLSEDLNVRKNAQIESIIDNNYESNNPNDYSTDFSNKNELISEALDIENPYLAFAVNAGLDPSTWAGVGLLNHGRKGMLFRNSLRSGDDAVRKGFGFNSQKNYYPMSNNIGSSRKFSNVNFLDNVTEANLRDIKTKFNRNKQYVDNNIPLNTHQTNLMNNEINLLNKSGSLVDDAGNITLRRYGPQKFGQHNLDNAWYSTNLNSPLTYQNIRGGMDNVHTVKIPATDLSKYYANVGKRGNEVLTDFNEFLLPPSITKNATSVPFQNYLDEILYKKYGGQLPKAHKGGEDVHGKNTPIPYQEHTHDESGDMQKTSSDLGYTYGNDGTPLMLQGTNQNAVQMDNSFYSVADNTSTSAHWSQNQIVNPNEGYWQHSDGTWYPDGQHVLSQGYAKEDPGFFDVVGNVLANPYEAFARGLAYNGRDAWDGTLGEGYSLDEYGNVPSPDGFNFMNEIVNPAKWVENIDNSLDQGNYTAAGTEAVLSFLPFSKIFKGGAKGTKITNKIPYKNKVITNKADEVINPTAFDEVGNELVPTMTSDGTIQLRPKIDNIRINRVEDPTTLNTNTRLNYEDGNWYNTENTGHYNYYLKDASGKRLPITNDRKLYTGYLSRNAADNFSVLNSTKEAKIMSGGKGNAPLKSELVLPPNLQEAIRSGNIEKSEIGEWLQMNIGSGEDISQILDDFYKKFGGDLPKAQNGVPKNIYSTREKNLEAKNYLREYLMSPMYLERLAIEFPGYPKEVIEAERDSRLNNLNTVKVSISDKPLNKAGNYGGILGQYVPKEHNQNTESLRLNKEAGFPPHSIQFEPNPHPFYQANNLHEYSHALESDQVSQKTANFIDGITNHSSDYLRTPTEFVARIQAIRYRLYQEGLYNPMTEEFTEEHLKLLKNNFDIRNDNHYRDLYDILKGDTKEQDKNLIKSMNEIAMELPTPDIGSQFYDEKLAKEGTEVKDPFYRREKYSTSASKFRRGGEKKELPKYQKKGEFYPVHIQSDRDKKLYDLAMSKGWFYDSRLKDSGYFFTQEALDKELEKAGFAQNTHYGGRKLNKDGLLTLDQTQGDRFSFSYDEGEYSHFVDADENNRMMKLINTGNWGYNPSTGQMVELNKPTKRQLTEEQHLMDTEKYAKLNIGANQGFTSDEDKSYIKKNFTEKEQEIINKKNKDLRKGYVGDQMKLAYQNPIMYAPGALYMGAIAGPTLLTAGSTNLTRYAGTSLFDIAGYWGGYEGATHLPKDFGDFIENPSLSSAGDVAVDLLGVAGGLFSSYNALSNLTKSGRQYTAGYNQLKDLNKTDLFENTFAGGNLSNKQIKILADNPNLKNKVIQTAIKNDPKITRYTNVNVKQALTNSETRKALLADGVNIKNEKEVAEWLSTRVHVGGTDIGYRAGADGMNTGYMDTKYTIPRRDILRTTPSRTKSGRGFTYNENYGPWQTKMRVRGTDDLLDFSTGTIDDWITRLDNFETPGINFIKSPNIYNVRAPIDPNKLNINLYPNSTKYPRSLHNPFPTTGSIVDPNQFVFTKTPYKDFAGYVGGRGQQIFDPIITKYRPLTPYRLGGRKK